jgi:hypothetical protein
MAAFQANPLSLSVPNDFLSGWVNGNKEEAERPRKVASAAEAAKGGGKGRRGGGGGAVGPGRPLRYKMPHLTVDDLRRPAKGWREFLCTDFIMKSYSVPRSIVGPLARHLGNVSPTFIPNTSGHDTHHLGAAFM